MNNNGGVTMRDVLQPEPADDDQETLFDVRVVRPDSVPLEGLRQALIDRLHLDPAKADALMMGFQSGPKVVLGRSVSRDRADRARHFEKLGLQVEIAPVLSLAPKSDLAPDGTVCCPACGVRVKLGPERQCPSCDVYVDKVTPEFLLRRKILEQEKARLAWAHRRPLQEQHEDAATLEARLRQEIRAELEARDGRQRRGRWREALATWQGWSVLALTGALAFAAGWSLPSLWPHGDGGGAVSLAAQGQPRWPSANGKGPDIDTLLARLDEFAPAAGQASSQASGADEDALRPTVAGRAAPGDATVLTAALERQWQTLDARRSAALTAPEAGAVPRDLRPQWAAQLALSLAQAGQAARALEAVNALDDWRRGASPATQVLLRRTRLLVDAWAMVDRHPAAAEARLQRVRSDAAALTDPAERALTVSALSTVLAHHGNVPDALLQGLMTQAADAIKTMADPSIRAELTEQWLIEAGQQQLIRGRQDAAAGRQSQLRSRVGLLRSLVEQATLARTRTPLLAMQALAQRQLADTKAPVVDWLAPWRQIDDVVQQAQVLRAVAALHPGAVDESVRQGAAALLVRADSAGGWARAQALSQLALLWAEVGQEDAFRSMRERALTGAAPDAASALRLQTELLVGGDLGLAGAWHREGEYTQADQRWRAAAAYLL